MIRRQIGELAKGSLIYGLGGMINRLLSLLLLPLFTRFLSPGDYGIISLFSVATLFFTGIFSLGTGNSIGILYFSEAPEQKGKVVGTTFILVLGNSLLFTVLILLFSKEASTLLLDNPDYADIVMLGIIAFFFQIISMPLLSYLRMERLVRMFVVINSSGILLALTLNVIFVAGLDRGVRGMFEASLISSVFIFILAALVVFRTLRASIGFERSLLVKLVRVGLPSILGLAAFYVIDWSDRVLLEKLLSLEVVGIYFMGYSIGMAINLMVDAFGSAWAPYSVSYIAREDEAKILFGKIFKYYCVSMGLVTLCFFMFSKPVVFLLTAPQYHACYTIIGIIASSYMLKGTYLILLPGIVFRKKLGLQSMIEWAAAGVNFGLNLLLIPLLQIEGAAIATLISYLSLNILCFHISSRLMKVVYEWKKILIFAAFYTVIACCSYFQTDSLWLSMLINVALLAFLVVFTFLFTLGPDERQFINVVKWKSIL